MGMLSINTNVGALKAADAAYSVNKSMETSMLRLSSGKRINSAIDDAAGLQISQRMTAEIRGFAQAARNAADAQSMLATMEGAIAEQHNILQRLREIGVQAASDTNNAADRTALQSEADALEAEISRISDDTTWANIQLIDTNTTSFTFHVGPDAADTITHAQMDMAHWRTTGYNIADTNVVTTRATANTLSLIHI